MYHATLTNSLLESAAFTRSIALGIMLRDAKEGACKIARRRSLMLGFSVVLIVSATFTCVCAGWGGASLCGTPNITNRSQFRSLIF